MRILIALLLLTLGTAVLSQDDTTDPTQEPTASTPTTVTTTPTVTEPTTPSVTEPTTPTVTEPTTTSQEPTKPTPEPTKPTPEPTTTTRKPTTTTNEPVPTTKEPVVPTTMEPVPEPNTCTFNVTQGGVTCIRAELKAKFTINEDKHPVIYLGCNATYSRSDCSSNETQTLVLVEPTHTLTMIFGKEGGKVLLRNVTFNFTLPSGESGFGESHEPLFNVKAGNSYLCKSETKVKLDNVTMEVSDMHIQAFEEKDNENFGTAEECDADDKVSDIVPIAVGVALAALIIIVLIAYLVGRRRSRQKGYQSV